MAGAHSPPDTPFFAMRHLRWQVLIAVLGMLLVGRMLAGRGVTSRNGVVEVIQDVPAAGGTYTEALIGAPSRFNPLLDFANPVDRDIEISRELHGRPPG